MSQTPSPPNVTPPMQPGPLGPGPGPAWPKVIGIITVVFGGFGVLGGVWALLATFLFGGVMFKGFANAGAQASIAASMLKWRWWTVTSSLSTIALAILLIAGGVGLIQLRRRGPRLLRIWAILRILFALITAAITIQLMKEQTAAISSQSTGVPPAAFMASALIFGVGFGLIWAIALPTFLLIFLGRARPMWGQGQCQNCGYELAGLRGTICPECGKSPA